jgi:hypothetical protein
MMTISNTQRQILAAAAQHDARLASAPRCLPAGSSNSPGPSCPSDCATGPTSSNQWDLVLRDLCAGPLSHIK